MITFKPCLNLEQAAQTTFNNMQPYYQHYGVDWQQSKILEQTLSLENLDILDDGQVVGVVRLAFDNETCFLRDLQVIKSAQNKGVGAQTIEKVKQLALSSNVNCVSLKVFKVSPAQHLYQRQGFCIINEDERFFYMQSLVS